MITNVGIKAFWYKTRTKTSIDLHLAQQDGKFWGEKETVKVFGYYTPITYYP